MLANDNRTRIQRFGTSPEAVTASVSAERSISSPVASAHAGQVPREPLLLQLKAHWETVRGDNALAFRSDIDPNDLRFMLPSLMLVEAADTLDAFRIRLFGTALVQEFGEDRTGKRFADLRHVANFEEAYADFERVRRTMQPSYLTGRSISADRCYRGYSRLLLPLTLNGNSVDIILGGYAFS